MSPGTTDRLPDSLLSLLNDGCPALLLTLGPDGFPNTAYTWTVAPDNQTIRFGADRGSTTLANLERTGRASLQIIAPDNLIFLIKGTTTQIKAQIDAAPFKIAMMALHVVAVKDQSWPGVTVAPLAYHWAPEQAEAMTGMEQAVYAEMRSWSG